MASYREQARQQYDPSYNMKVQAQKNQLAQTQADLEAQKGGINSNYDLQVKNQNIQNKTNKNNLSNSALGRGLSNSSIVVSGLAEQDNINQRYIDNINTSRTADLNEIDRQKRLASQQTNATLAQMKADREDEIRALAWKIEDRDRDWQYKQSSLAMEREKLQAQREYQQGQLAISRQELALKQQQLAWEQSQTSSSSEKEMSPQDALADLRYDVASESNKYAVARNYATRYANVPGMEYVVKEAQYYANKYK